MSTKTLVTTFDDARHAERAVHALHDAGFARDDLGWVARSFDGEEIAHGAAARPSALEGAGVGGALGGLAGLLIGFAALAVPGIGPVVVAGPLVTALAGAGVGAAAGGIIDALVHIGVPKEDAHHYAERIRRGGAIVTVTVDDEEEEARAVAIFRGEAYQHHGSLKWRVPAQSDESGFDRLSAQSLF